MWHQPIFCSCWGPLHCGRIRSHQVLDVQKIKLIRSIRNFHQAFLGGFFLEDLEVQPGKKCIGKATQLSEWNNYLMISVLGIWLPGILIILTTQSHYRDIDIENCNHSKMMLDCYAALAGAFMVSSWNFAMSSMLKMPLNIPISLKTCPAGPAGQPQNTLKLSVPPIRSGRKIIFQDVPLSQLLGQPAGSKCQLLNPQWPQGLKVQLDWPSGKLDKTEPPWKHNKHLNSPGFFCAFFDVWAAYICYHLFARKPMDFQDHLGRQNTLDFAMGKNTYHWIHTDFNSRCSQCCFILLHFANSSNLENPKISTFAGQPNSLRHWDL